MYYHTVGCISLMINAVTIVRSTVSATPRSRTTTTDTSNWTHDIDNDSDDKRQEHSYIRQPSSNHRPPPCSYAFVPCYAICTASPACLFIFSSFLTAFIHTIIHPTSYIIIIHDTSYILMTISNPDYDTITISINSTL